jgi:oxygen-independent coproporphyrinogen-3 oxidase
MAGLYIHIPFCKQLCYYCDFYFSVSLQRKDELLNALIKEIALRAKENNPAYNQISTIYIGGGTPTVYSPSELGLLTAAVKANFSAANIVEFTVEANPDDLTPAYLESLKKLGVNRLSIGIQSFIDRDLKWMNRRHTAKEAIESVRLAQQVGFDNVTVDLIYGIPAMKLYEWRHNLEAALSLNIQHLSAYHLGIEEKTVFGKREQKGLLTQVEEEESEQQFYLLRELTANAGFEHYEISNFAKDGKYGIHNSSYWKQQPYIGIGPSAHSYDKERRRWNISNNIRYIKGLNSCTDFYAQELLAATTIYNEYLLTSLRTSWGIDLDYLKHTFGRYYYNHFTSAAQYLFSIGILVREDKSVKIPPAYFLRADAVISSLLIVADDNQ